MTARRGGLLAALRRILGRKAPPKPPPHRSSHAARAPMTEPWQPQAPDLPQVRYMKERASRTIKASPRDERRRRRLLLAVGGGLLALITLGTGAVLLLFRSTLPEPLVGTWRTDDPRYATRRLELLDDQVVFQVGDSSFAVERYAISRVRSRRSANGRLYRITYLGAESEPIELHMYFEDRSGTLRLANQMEFAWRRTGPPGPKPRALLMP